jgi:Flp pilus assembly protein TadD
LAERIRRVTGRPFLRKFDNMIGGGHTHDNRASRLRLALGALLIFALVLAVYRPILPGSFLIDDHRLIGSDNPLVNGELTPRTIWFQTDFTLTTFAWWVERMNFGENPAGYHVANMVLHAISAILLWALLARLKIPGAWLAGAIFAVHPVCVNSVARIAELKNTLSLPFFLLSFLGYLCYEAAALYPAGPDPTGHHRSRSRAALWYGFSLIAFVLALLSKTSTVMLPVVLLGCAAWQRGRVTRNDLLHTGPFFVLALAFGLMSVWFQKHQALASATAILQPASFFERLAVAGRIPWFYLGKALLPINLNLYYPRWNPNAASVTAYLPGLLFCALLVLCWWFRRGWGRHVLFGLGCFAVMLFPVLGFFDSQFLTMWQVSDHLQYQPLMAVVALAAAGLACLLPKRIFRGTAIVVLLTLSALTFKHAQLFATEEGLLRDTIARNPAAWPVQNDLGVILAKRNDYPAAIEHFTASLQSNPDNPDAHANLGHALVLQGKFEEAETHFRVALKLKPDDSDAHANFAEALARQGRAPEAILHLRAAIRFEPRFKPKIEPRMELAMLLYQTGDTRQAVAQFHQVLSLKPDQPEVLNNLAWILATGSDDQARNGAEAVRCAERACQLTAFKKAGMVGTLAAAYAEAGRFPEAVTNAELAVKLANAAGDTQFAAVNQQLLSLYRAGKPWHSPPAVNRSQ